MFLKDLQNSGGNGKNNIHSVNPFIAVEKCENGLIPLKDKCGGLLGLPCPKDYMCDYSNVPAGRFDYFGICCKSTSFSYYHLTFYLIYIKD